MPLRERLRSSAPYLFILVGLVWIALAYDAYTNLLGWPAGVCLVSGVLLRFRRDANVTVSFSRAASLFGFLVSAYQVYVASLLIGGPFTVLASSSVAAFSLFAAVHVILFYSAGGQQKKG
jgi:hypothetical protein